MKKTSKLIEKLILEADNDTVSEEREREIIDMLPGLRAQEAIEKILESTPVLELSEKQMSFYNDIKIFLTEYALSKRDSFLKRETEDQSTPSGDALLITIRRISNLLTMNLNKNNFSEIVDDFYYLKNGDMFTHIGKHKHLRNCWE